jgi:hypothetical protein
MLFSQLLPECVPIALMRKPRGAFHASLYPFISPVDPKDWEINYSLK